MITSTKGTFAQNSVTMSSLEIAKLTGKQHAHVCRDIRNMLQQLAEAGKQEKYSTLDEGAPEYDRGTRKQYKYLKPSSFERVADHFKKDDPDPDHLAGVAETRDARGYVTCYNLNFDYAITLVAGYRADLRLKIIQRWHELEAQTIQDRLTPAEYNELLEKQGKTIVDRAAPFPCNPQFHKETVNQLLDASCRFSVAQELAERVGMKTDCNHDPAHTFCNDAWAIAYLVKDASRMMGDAITILSPLTMPRNVKPAVSPTLNLQIPAPETRPSNAWKDPTKAEELLKSMRFKLEEMYNMALITPAQVEELHKAKMIGTRQMIKLRRLMEAQ